MRLIWQRYFELFASVKLGNLAGHSILNCSSQVERLPDYLQCTLQDSTVKNFLIFPMLRM